MKFYLECCNFKVFHKKKKYVVIETFSNRIFHHLCIKNLICFLEAKPRPMNLTELQEEYVKFDEDVSIFPSPSVGEYIGLDVRKPVFSICEQQRRRPTCASAQTGQHLSCTYWSAPLVSTYWKVSSLDLL